METWHDDASSPQLVACSPSGFRYVESARPRNNLSTSTNHGNVRLFYEPSLYARTAQLPVFTTFEAVAAFIHRAGFKAVVVVIYQPVSCSVTQTCYDDFSDLLERLSTYSAPLMIAGDFNMHETGKLADLLSCCSLRQHVFSATHVQGHALDLDLLITRDDESIAVCFPSIRRCCQTHLSSPTVTTRRRHDDIDSLRTRVSSCANDIIF